MTSNRYYGALNRRFDKRARFLLNLGYEYVGVSTIKVGDDDMSIESVGMFIRAHTWRWGKSVIQSANVMHLNNRAWRDELRRHLRRF